MSTDTLLITMGTIQVFHHEQFGEIRTMTMPDGQVGFVGNEVAKVLGYSNYRNAIANHVDEDDKLRTQIEYAGQKREVTFINESGLYSLILSSKLPKAREFKHWVTSEVLPQIRKTGGYLSISEDDDDNTIMAKALLVAQKTIEKKDEIIGMKEEIIAQKNEIIVQKNALLTAQRPKVLFADAVTSQDDSILISEMAKLLTQNGYEIGRTRLFRWLRENGYLFKKSTEPIQKWVERGIFDTHVTIINTHHGQRESLTTKVTGKGQKYFIDLFLKIGTPALAC